MLALTAASAVAPGTAHLIAGRRRSGTALLAVFLVMAAAMAGFGLRSTRSELVRLAVKPAVLATIVVAAGLFALAWIGLVLWSYFVLKQPNARTGEKVAGAVVLTVLCVAVAVPPAAVARYAYVQRDLITTVFSDEDVTSVDEGKPVAKDDPWKGRSRINLLLIAADSGPDRTGTRTDSLVVLSADTHSGDVVMFSLPRNLAHVPMPPGPLADQWPNGFPEYLNAVYRRVGENHLLASSKDPGAAALKAVSGELLGLRVDYYIMINMEGFERFVNALGGVTINVPTRLPIGGLDAYNNPVPPSGYIEAGRQHLNGFQAQWFARSRSASSDYDRMDRQRCLIAAMAKQVQPAKVLTRFQELANATKDLVSTDIPQQLLAPLVELGDKIRTENNIRSLTFTPPTINPNNPDFADLKAKAQAALKPPAKTTTPPKKTPTSTTPTTGSPTPPVSTTAAGGTTAKPGASGGRVPPAGAAESVNDVCLP